MKKIAVKNFFRPFGQQPRPLDLYESELGWGQIDYDRSMASMSQDVLRYYLDVLQVDIEFFYTKTMRWYVIDNYREHNVCLSVIRTRDDWDGKYLDDSIGTIDYESGEDIPDVVFKTDSVDKFLESATIHGVPISEVMNLSWIQPHY